MASDHEIESPCTNLCEISTETRRCTGCGRTMEEIFRWPTMPDEERHRIMERLAPEKAPGRCSES
jgi:predicted Fe-S protein YdhL (DUF1289 family)